MSAEEHRAALAGPEGNIRFIEVNNLWPKVRHLLRLMSSGEVRPETTARIAAMGIPASAAESIRDLDEFRELAKPFFSETDEFRNLDGQFINAIVTVAYFEVTGLSVLFELYFDPKISEIMVDAYDKVTVERGGMLLSTAIRFRDSNHVQDIAKRLAKAVSDRDLSPANPLVTAELPSARVALAIDQVVKSGVSIAIRRFPPLMKMAQLLEFGALTDEMRTFLNECVLARATVLVSGGTGTGKTTMVNALSEAIPPSERCITIEDSYELKLDTEFWVPMQSRERAGGDDQLSVTLADLLRASLRMRPDRIIVGEIREAMAAATFLMAANTGHDGSMSTIHSSSPSRACNFRLPGLLRRDRDAGGMPQDVAIAEVASAIELVVQITREAGRRFISEIAVIDEGHMVNREIVPIPIFKGELNDEGRPEFTRVGRVPRDTSLGLKLSETDAGRHWLQEASP